MALDLALGQRVFTVALNLALVLSVGANLSLAWAARNRSAWTAGCLPRLGGVAIAAALAAIAAAVAVLWTEAAVMSEVDVLSAGPAAATLLAETQYGHAWLGGMLFLVFNAAMAMLLRHRRGAIAAALGLLSALAFFYTRSMTSHAASDGNLTWAMFADWAHLVLISLWIGEVAIAGFLVLPRCTGTDSDSRRDCAHYLQALSLSATIAVVGITLTGVFNSLHNLSSVADLSGNPYGTTLLLKVAFVALAALLGGINRFLVMPSVLAQLRDPGASLSSQRTFVLILKIEAIVLVSALILAAMLSSTSPPTMA